ncbi:Membrane fusion protein (MFP) family protein [uncultured Gammaproteobacteria bacterium]
MAELFVGRDSSENLTTIARKMRAVTLTGWAGLLVFIFALGIWMATAALESAAIASGTITVVGERKTIQHLEGGTVAKLMVEEGDIVGEGQILLELDNTASSSNAQIYYQQKMALLAQLTRLEAEQRGATSFVFPPEIINDAKKYKGLADEIKVQVDIFDARNRSLENSRSILLKRIEQFEDESRGLAAGLVSLNSQLRLIAEEIETVEELFKKGIATKPRLLALKRSDADLTGRRGDIESQITKARDKISEAKLQILNLDKERDTEIVTKLREVQNGLSEVNERLRAADSILKRVVIHAPVAGRVMNLTVHTVGGVVRPGEPIMAIIPGGVDLIVTAMARPDDIDVIAVDQPVRVRLTAYRSRIMPSLEGKVLKISPDAITDVKTGRVYYEVRASITLPSEYAWLKLYPGMQAEVYIKTGARTLLEYLISSLLVIQARALRED